MSSPFHRTLPDELTVTVDGTCDLDPDITDRRPVRVVIAMPDYVADSLAHLLGNLSRVADLLGAPDTTGVDAAELAQALYEAATSGDYHCPQGSLTGEVA